MARYEYKCLVCDVSFVQVRSIESLPEEYFCEHCGYSLKRVYSNVGVAFRGNGFYSTEK